MLIKPRGIYQVTNGDKLEIDCTGYGAPVPSVMLRFPKQFNNSTLKSEIKFTKRKGYIKFEFVADKKFQGNYTCTSRNSLGSSTDWVQVIGEFSLLRCVSVSMLYLLKIHIIYKKKDKKDQI